MNYRAERGEGGIKNLILLAIVGFAILAAAKIIPANIDDKTMRAATEEMLKFAGTQSPPLKPKDMVFQLTEKAQELNIPVKESDISVVEEGPNFRARLKYKRVIPVLFYTYRKDVNIDVTYQKY